MTDQPALLDDQWLDDLCQGNCRFFCELYELFDQQLVECQNLLAQQPSTPSEFQNCCTLLHRLKGSAAAMGLNALANTLRAAETNAGCKACDSNTVPQYNAIDQAISEIQHQGRLAKQALSEYAKSRSYDIK